ncbi:hypothetical protein AB0F77_10660 [Streptomyces sp. NPDC026672]|uniref:hypothetical protein n=1 Tax=unclassified Streptomyces TaxID=2593676 RepID=UPI0033CF1FC0
MPRAPSRSSWCRTRTAATPRRAIPHIGFEIVDVRDLADVHVRAMTAPTAGGEHFIATGEFLWASEIVDQLRSGAGPLASRVPTRRLPDTAVRVMARFTPGLRAVAPYHAR